MNNPRVELELEMIMWDLGGRGWQTRLGYISCEVIFGSDLLFWELNGFELRDLYGHLLI